MVMKSLYIVVRTPDGAKKAFPWGLCPAQRIEIFMTAGGSHTIPKWLCEAKTDEGR